MTRTLSPALLLAFVLAPVLAACGGVGDAPRAETAAADSTADEAAPEFTGTPLAITPATSRIAWKAAKVSLAHDGGFREFDGALYMDGETPTGVDVTIQTPSIFSDNDRLTGHLQSDDFFAVATYPEARFRAPSLTPITPAAADSAAAAGLDGATHRVEGTLEMHGVTNRIAFPARVTVGADSVVADADFVINRKDWGIVYTGQPDDLINDDVRLILHVAAPRAASADGVAAADPAAR